MMKLVGCVPAIGLAGVAKFFVFRGTFLPGLKTQLYRTPDILAILTALIIYVSLY